MIKTILKDKIEKYEIFQDILNFSNTHNIVKCKGITGSFNAFFIAFLKKYKKILFLADSVEDCEKMRDDLSIITDRRNVEILLPLEHYPYSSAQIDDERKGERLIALDKLYSKKHKIIISTYRNLFEKLPQKRGFSSLKMTLKVGKELNEEKLSQKLTKYNFTNVHLVENIGEYSIKGSIIDIYPYASEFPIRIELFGDEIESMRLFDPVDQKKIKNIANANIHLSDITEIETTNNLLEFIDDDSIVVFDKCDDALEKFEYYYQNKIIEGHDRSIKSDKKHYSDKYFDSRKIIELLNTKKVIYNTFSDDKIDFSLNIKSPTSYRYDFSNFLSSLKNNVDNGYLSFILCDNPGQRERFIEIIEEQQLGFEFIKVELLDLHSGFLIPDLKISVYTDHQIFGRDKRPKNYRRFKKVIPLKRIKKLKHGDFVVHIDHGIGQYMGLQKITVGGSERDVIKILYKGSEFLYLKLDYIEKIKKYSASEGIVPSLSKLGGKQFALIKERTKKNVKSIAHDLIKIYAERKKSKGFVFPTDTIWQTELESSFEFQDTPDQRKATIDFKKDMETGMPMDRLVCGDVGFGKTEIAIRAAFKAVSGGKQVAMLAPTTILVFQHYTNFKKRMERYPVNIDFLSRLKTRKEQLDTLIKLKEGKIDILISTHRLLSKDVEFKDLGLLIVDEEQRFGVSDKEKIKELKVNVGVLTLTATPIPRTLHMSLLGVRDLSLINTPPVNRLPIKTEVHRYEKNIIFEAIMKEVDRGGQVFFVHNRVENIESMKFSIEEMVPDVSIAIAHGQMKPRELEKVMFDFMMKRYDVLITTTIVENGVDIPNVNTLIVNRADAFGLSQLYQLRGRIGRSHRQAYAYFLIPSPAALSAVAKKRLDTLSEFTDLGAGFQIAMRDLEIRGAGSLLGREQSGFIESVGFDLYTKILEDAVNELKGKEFNEVLKDIGNNSSHIKKAGVNLKTKMFLPENYIQNDSERVDLYRRLSACKTMKDINDVREEVQDRFGSEPKEAKNLFENLTLSVYGGKFFIKTISLKTSLNSWFVKVIFDAVELEILDNTEKALQIGENIDLLRKSGKVQMKLEQNGEIIYFYPEPEFLIKNAKFEFVKFCLDKLFENIEKKEQSKDLSV